MTKNLSRKNTVRKILKIRMQQMSDRERRNESASICHELRKRCADQHQIIAVFMPLPDEPDIDPFIKECLSAQKSICTPEWKQPDLEFKIIRSMDDITVNTKTGIREPAAKIPSINPAEITHVLVPGRAFTQAGGRLGRGGGTYDRWIKKQRKENPATRFIGVCFPCQILDELPMEKYDEMVDDVVTGEE